MKELVDLARLLTAFSECVVLKPHDNRQLCNSGMH